MWMRSVRMYENFYAEQRSKNYVFRNNESSFLHYNSESVINDFIEGIVTDIHQKLAKTAGYDYCYARVPPDKVT